MRNYILIFILIFVFYNCNTTFKHLKDDKLIKKYFTESEIKDLVKILSFFEVEVSKNCNNDTIQVCLEQFLENSPDFFKKGDIPIDIKKEYEMLHSISDSTFYKIWEHNFHSKDSIFSISVKSKSRYIDFLTEMGNSREHIRAYYNPTRSQAPISLHLTWINYVNSNYKRFNLNDEKERLILAIHFLTVKSDFFSKENFVKNKELLYIKD